MKKSLVALATVGTFGLANAQTSVTLFGVVDATLARGSGSLGKVNRLTNSGYNSSRLGFRGTEDIGGGTRASFWLEAGLNNDDGRGGNTNFGNQTTTSAGGGGLTFNRRSTVSLSGEWGEIRLGRDYTPHFLNLTIFDPFATNGVGTTQVLNGSQTAGSRGGPVNVRASNSIGYLLPALQSGLYGQVQAYLGENLKNGAATENDGTGYSTRFGYSSGPVNVAIAISRTQYATGNITTANIGGQWNFGDIKLLGHYSQDDVKLPADVTGKGWLLGGLWAVGTGEVRASYSSYKDDLAGRNLSPATRKLAIGYVHNLSKRTAVYGTYARLTNKNGAAQALNASTTAPDRSSAGLDVGLRLTF